MFPDRLASKTAIVTGSSSGLGRAIALAFAREGATTIICADLEPGARKAVESETEVDTDELIRREFGEGRAVFVKMDVTRSGDWEEVVRKGVELGGGRIDVLVNNAGISWESRNKLVKLHETPEEAWDQTMAVNAKSVWLGCKYVLGQMVKQEPFGGPDGDRGWIINISSIYGLVGSRAAPSYAASKGAVTNLTRSLALDYAEHKIHVNAINPGFVRTGIFVDTTANLAPREMIDALHPFKGSGLPDDIAGAAVFLASHDAKWVTGVNLPVDGGYTAQ